LWPRNSRSPKISSFVHCGLTHQLHKRLPLMLLDTGEQDRQSRS
jgi:hypothetical protein